MRVNSIINFASYGKYNIKGGVGSSSSSSGLQKQAENTTPFYIPSFSSVVYFSTVKKNHTKLNAETVDKYIKTEPIPKEVFSLFKRAKDIEKSSAVVLDNFKGIHGYVKDTINKVEEDYLSIKTPASEKKSGGILEETNDFGKVIKKTIFDSKARIKMIKDYETERIISFDYEDEQGKNTSKFTIYVDCADMDDPNYINAKASYTVKAGMLYRYAKNCTADIDANSDRFIAKTAYTFKRNALKGYDKDLTIVAGTEYSNEYFEYLSNPLLDYSEVKNRPAPLKYIKGKVATKGLIRYSTDEVSFSYYGLTKR